MNRRAFLNTMAAAGASTLAYAASATPTIDTHIHLFDPTRAQGVPWPDKNDKVLYHPALPDRYRPLATPFGITGAIEIECSPWLEDNQWVLDVAARNKIIVGTVGNLEPGTPDFRKHFDRFHRNPLFLGIRYGNLWNRDLAAQVSKPEFISDLKTLADSGLELDTANPTPSLMKAVLQVSDRVPNLRIVIDHLPELDPATCRPELRHLSARPRVYVKISGILRRVDGRVPLDLNFYRARLDELWDLFGENRLIYGSDWPNSDLWGPYPEVFRLAHEYFKAKGAEVSEKFFWKNSLAAYRWVKRDPSQPSLI